MIRYYTTSKNRQLIQSLEVYCKLFMELDSEFRGCNKRFMKAAGSIIEWMSDRNASSHGHPESIAFLDMKTMKMRIYA